MVSNYTQIIVFLKIKCNYYFYRMIKQRQLYFIKAAVILHKSGSFAS